MHDVRPTKTCQSTGVMGLLDVEVIELNLGASRMEANRRGTVLTILYLSIVTDMAYGEGLNQKNQIYFWTPGGLVPEFWHKSSRRPQIWQGSLRKTLFL